MTHTALPVGWLTLLVITGLVAGCSAEQAEAPTPIPRVRVFEVGAESSGQLRRASGQLVAADSSPLAFGIAGTVDRVHVEVGDSVSKGQVLATLDPDPTRQALERARSELSSNRAKLVEAEQAYTRAEALFSQQVGSRANVEVATANVQSARSALRASQSKVGDAERDSSRIALTAPVAGRVSERSVEPFQEVGAAEPVIVIQSQGALVARVQVAEAMIRHVDYAQQVRVTFPTQPDTEMTGFVSLIAAQAGPGNGFPVEIQLPESDIDLRPGMTASVTFNFSEYLDGRTVYLIPISAVAIDRGLATGAPPDENEVPLFVLDEAAGVVRARSVKVGGLRGNELEVFDGLEAGDLVISAGVPFLRDGMEARRWDPELGLVGG